MTILRSGDHWELVGGGEAVSFDTWAEAADMWLFTMVALGKFE